MKGVIKKDLLQLLTRVIDILQTKETKDLEELKNLSEQAIEDVAVQKDLDLVSLTVLIYSIYKILPEIKEENYKDIVVELNHALQNLQQSQYGRYNQSIKSLYTVISRENAKVKVHLQDVMQAARIKKSASLLRKGLSIGQAAGLMGLSNWDLQQYVGGTTMLDLHKEILPVNKRMDWALQIFGVK
ncbi:MAG: hypothetical protein WCV90_06730 [Candidatus Woesearchaeota archaeon]|jgi:hypothetical protein